MSQFNKFQICNTSVGLTQVLCSSKRLINLELDDMHVFAIFYLMLMAMNRLIFYMFKMQGDLILCKFICLLS